MTDISRIIGRMVAPDETRSKWLRYGLAVILAILSFLPSWLIFNFNKAPYFSLFTMAVVITSLYAGRNPGAALHRSLHTACVLCLSPCLDCRPC